MGAMADAWYSTARPRNGASPSWTPIKAFVTPWRVPRPCFNEVIGIMVKVCGRYSIPVFNSAEKSGIYVWDAQFRKLFFQGPNDTAHLNAKGHRLFMRKGESFLLGL